jgi:hypothetical protein
MAFVPARRHDYCGRFPQRVAPHCAAEAIAKRRQDFRVGTLYESPFKKPLIARPLFVTPSAETLSAAN